MIKGLFIAAIGLAFAVPYIADGYARILEVAHTLANLPGFTN